MEELNQKEVSRLRKEIDSVQSRFFHLLSITSVVMMVLAGGFVLRLFPKLIWNLEALETRALLHPAIAVRPVLSGRRCCAGTCCSSGDR